MGQVDEPQAVSANETAPEVHQRRFESPTQQRADKPPSTEETLNDQSEAEVNPPKAATYSPEHEAQDSTAVDLEKVATAASSVTGQPPGVTIPKNTTPAANDPNTVWWDGDDDPENPYNWPSWRKVVNCSLISALTFLTPLASSIFAPGVPSLMADFESDIPCFEIVKLF